MATLPLFYANTEYVAGQHIFKTILDGSDKLLTDLALAPTCNVMTIQNGTVGIGTANPTAALHVVGNVLASGTITASNISVIGDFVTLNTITSNTEQMVITNDGTGPALKVTQTGDNSVAEFYDNESGIALFVGNGGNVGIGTTSPQASLHVEGTLRVNQQASFYNITFPVWLTAARPINPVTGTIGFNSTTGNLELYDGSAWFNVGNKKPDGLSPNTAAISATQLKADYPSYPDGLYYYTIPGTTATVQLYTDMTRDGGGWIIISKWGGYSKTTNTIFDSAEQNINLLTNENFESFASYARLSRSQMNAIWLSSKYVCRIHFKNTASTATSGVYFQNKLLNVSTFDLWKAHYSPLYWSDFITSTASHTGGGGTNYEVCFSNANIEPTLSNYNGNASTFNPTSNRIIGGTAINAGMGFWDRVQVNAPGLGNFEVGRHMGFFGDISGSSQWIFTNNPSDSRFATNEAKQTIVFLRW